MSGTKSARRGAPRVAAFVLLAWPFAAGAMRLMSGVHHVVYRFSNHDGTRNRWKKSKDTSQSKVPMIDGPHHLVELDRALHSLPEEESLKTVRTLVKNIPQHTVSVRGGFDVQLGLSMTSLDHVVIKLEPKSGKRSYEFMYGRDRLAKVDLYRDKIVIGQKTWYLKTETP